MANVLLMLYQNEKTLCNRLIIKALSSFSVNLLGLEPIQHLLLKINILCHHILLG